MDIPVTSKLAEVFSQAAAPAFFLGAVTGLVSILLTRLSVVTTALRSARNDHDSAVFRHLHARARLLHSAVNLALGSGICTALLLALSFIGAFLHLSHIYGAALLFLLATALVGLSLLQFFREIRIGLADLSRMPHVASE
jgi:predicted lysophospholipase L1 biosynthesis ABC-type transport system permease subunit